jgi:hypothetical protein
LPSCARRACRPVMSVSDVEHRNRANGSDEWSLVLGTHPPHRVLHAIGCGEVVERRHRRGDALYECVYVSVRAVRQKHRARLGTEAQQVTCSVVFLVTPRELVLPDDVALVLVHRVTGGDAGLGVAPHPQCVDIQAGCLLGDEGCLTLQSREVRRRPCVNSIGKRTRVRGKIDLGPGDVKETQRVSCRQGPRFVSVDDVVRDSGDSGGRRRRRTKRSKRSKGGHAFDYIEGYWTAVVTASGGSTRPSPKSVNARSRSTRKAVSSVPGTGTPGGIFRCSRNGLTKTPFFCRP